MNRRQPYSPRKAAVCPLCGDTGCRPECKLQAARTQLVGHERVILQPLASEPTRLDASRLRRRQRIPQPPHTPTPRQRPPTRPSRRPLAGAPPSTTPAGCITITRRRARRGTRGRTLATTTPGAAVAGASTAIARAPSTGTRPPHELPAPAADDEPRAAAASTSRRVRWTSSRSAPPPPAMSASSLTRRCPNASRSRRQTAAAAAMA